MKINVHDKRMILNIVFAFVVKGGAVIVGVLTIPAYMNYFPEQTILGVWYTVLSIITWVLNFDLGIGNGMRNLLAKAFVKNDHNEVKVLVSSAYISIGVLSCAFAIVGIIISYTLDWNRLLNVDQFIISAALLGKVIRIVFLGIIGQFFFKLVTSILNAMERTAISNMLPLLSNIIVLVYVSIETTRSLEERLLSLSWIYTLAVVIPYVAASIIVFSTKLKRSLPAIRSFTLASATSVLSLGGGFFGIQLAMMVLTVTNEIIITNLYGASCVVEFQIYNKVFYTVVTLFSLISNPVWSAVSTAMAEKRYKWVASTYKKLLLLATLASLFVVIIGFSFQWIVNLWLGDNSITVQPIIIISFVLYAIVLLYSYSESSIANGANMLKSQLLLYGFAAITKIPLCLLFHGFFDSWNSVIIVNSLCLMPYVIIEHFAIMKKICSDNVQSRSLENSSVQ